MTESKSKIIENRLCKALCVVWHPDCSWEDLTDAQQRDIRSSVRGFMVLNQALRTIEKDLLHPRIRTSKIDRIIDLKIQ